MEKIKKHFIQKKCYYISGALITFFMLTLYLFYGAFPFGQKTIAHYDLLQQILPFINTIFGAFEGKNTLLFTNHLGGGSNLVGYLCYFIFSPFYLIVILFGKANILYSINIVLILQFVTNALVFMWFIRKYFKLNSFYQIAFSLAYTFSAFTLLNYTFFSWMFLYTLLPILVDNFLKFIKTKKITGFTLTVIAMIFNSYSIGMFGQIVLFIFFTLFILLLTKKESQKVLISKLLVSYFIALTSSIFMLGPNILQLSTSSRLSNPLYQIFNKELFISFAYSLNYLIIDSVLFVLTIIFLIKYKSKNNFTKFLFLTLILSLLPILIDGINLVLSAGNYLGYNMRMGYILTFLAFIAAIYIVKQIQNKKEKETKYYNQEKIYAFILIPLQIITAIMIICLSFTLISRYLAHSLASEFSLIFYLFLTAIFLLVLFITTFKYSKNKVSKKFLISIFSFVFIFQIILNPIIFTCGGCLETTDITFLNEQSISLNVEDSRIKSFTPRGTNSHLFSNFSSFSCFASQVDSNTTKTNGAFGYLTESNTANSTGGTLLSDGFFGYEYYSSSRELNRPYLTFVSKKDINKNESIYLYKNNLSLNHAVIIDKNNTLDIEENIQANTNNLFYYLSGNKVEILKKYDTQNLIDNKYLSFDKNNVISVNFPTADKNKIIYFALKEFNTIALNQDEFQVATILKNTFTDIGFVGTGESLNITFSAESPLLPSGITFYELDYDLVESLLLAKQLEDVEVKYNNNGFTINTTAEANKKIVTTNINLIGRQLTLNNKQIESNKNLPIIEIELFEGNNIIESTYSYPYAKAFIIFCMVSLICLIIGIILNKLINKNKKFTNILYYTSLGFAITFAVIVYLFPSIVFVGRVIIFKF